MYKILKLAFCLFCAYSLAQQKSLNDIASFRMKNSGAFVDKNKDVDGYYFFYEVDRLKKGDREYAIKMLDNNLNDLVTKSYVDNKNTFLAQSNFNNQSLMFCMLNKKERFIKLVSFNRKGEQSDPKIIPVTKSEFKTLDERFASGSFNLLFPIDNQGFLLNMVKDNKRDGYSLKFISTNNGKSWEFNSPSNTKETLTLNPVQANENVIVALEGSNKSESINAVVIDIKTGKLLFRKSYQKSSNPRLITNAFITDDEKIVLLGEYFKKGDNVAKDKSLGLYSEVLSLSGQQISDNKVS